MDKEKFLQQLYLYFYSDKIQLQLLNQTEITIENFEYLLRGTISYKSTIEEIKEKENFIEYMENNYLPHTILFSRSQWEINIK